MTEIRIPGEILEPSDRVFPEGSFRGTIVPFDDDRDRIRPLPWDDTGINLAVKLDDNEAIDGPDPGARKFFFDVPLIRGDLKVDSDEAATFATALRKKETLTSDPKAIGAGFTRLVSLAKALGHLRGADTPFDPMAFAELCANGEFDGQSVRFCVYHRTDKNGKTYANIGEIAPA